MRPSTTPPLSNWPRDHAGSAAVSHLSAADIAAILDELDELIIAISEAEPDHELEVYRSLGLRLTYHHETQTVRAEIDLDEHRWDWFVPERQHEPKPNGSPVARIDQSRRVNRLPQARHR